MPELLKMIDALQNRLVDITTEQNEEWTVHYDGLQTGLEGALVVAQTTLKELSKCGNTTELDRCATYWVLDTLKALLTPFYEALNLEAN